MLVPILSDDNTGPCLRSNWRPPTLRCSGSLIGLSEVVVLLDLAKRVYFFHLANFIGFINSISDCSRSADSLAPGLVIIRLISYNSVHRFNLGHHAQTS